MLDTDHCAGVADEKGEGAKRERETETETEGDTQRTPMRDGGGTLTTRSHINNPSPDHIKIL